jgi:hypothetical protein
MESKIVRENLTKLQHTYIFYENVLKYFKCNLIILWNYWKIKVNTCLSRGRIERL